MIRHPFGHDAAEVDLSALRSVFTARLGRPVELLTSEPTADDPAGVLIVTDAVTDAHLDVDPALVTETVAAHTSSPRRSREEVALAELDAAPNPTAKLDAVRRYLAGRVADDKAHRERARQVRRLAERHQ